jgi:hypothetical protein
MDLLAVQSIRYNTLIVTRARVCVYVWEFIISIVGFNYSMDASPHG